MTRQQHRRASSWLRAGTHLGASSVTLRADLRSGSELLEVGAIFGSGGWGGVP